MDGLTMPAPGAIRAPRAAHALLLGRYIPARALLLAAYGSVFVGGLAAFAVSLSEKTDYGLTYRVWFGALVVIVLAIAVAPIVGARVGGLDWDLGTMKDHHLGGYRIFRLQLSALGYATAVGFIFVLVGVCSALVVGLIGTLGAPSLAGDGHLLSNGMVIRLFIAAGVGIPFAGLVGWAMGVVLRSSLRGALLAEVSLLLYIMTVPVVAGTSTLAPLRLLYRYSPWGALAATAGDYQLPSVAVDPVMGPGTSAVAMCLWAVVILLGAGLVSARRDIGGGGAS
ncbi:MAG: hypothetical protein GX113_01555 [Actinobacteria bacterium]|jgi:hypothetical protein|nr:hypothetical protein [Actinomycetota bacterium]